MAVLERIDLTMIRGTFEPMIVRSLNISDIWREFHYIAIRGHFTYSKNLYSTFLKFNTLWKEHSDMSTFNFHL